MANFCAPKPSLCSVCCFKSYSPSGKPIFRVYSIGFPKLLIISPLEPRFWSPNPAPTACTAPGSIMPPILAALSAVLVLIAGNNARVTALPTICMPTRLLPAKGTCSIIFIAEIRATCLSRFVGSPVKSEYH